MMSRTSWFAVVLCAMVSAGCGDKSSGAKGSGDKASSAAPKDGAGSARAAGSGSAGAKGSSAPIEITDASQVGDPRNIKSKLDSGALGGVGKELMAAPTVETTDKPEADDAELASGFVAETDEPKEGDPEAQPITTPEKFASAPDEVQSAAPENKPSGYARFRRVEFAYNADSLVIKTAGIEAFGQGSWASTIVAMQDGQFVSESGPKQFSIRGESGATGGQEFGLAMASGGLEKLKGEVIFHITALKKNGDKFELVNHLPAVVAEMRYGKIVQAFPTYASLVNGRLFRAGGVKINGQAAVSIVTFQYDSQNDCLFMRYMDAVAHQNRFDEALGYEGCANIGSGEMAFNVEATCTYAMNNEPKCKKYSENVTTKFINYPYGIGIFNRIFRDPSALQ